MRGGSPLGAAPRDAKLLIVSPEPGSLHDFANLIAPIPEVSLASAGPPGDGSVGSVDLAVMGRIAVDAQVGIELLHVPLEPHLAPLWPLAGHAALGTLFLLSGSVSADAERVSAMTEVLRRQPRARLFHVILFRKDERVSPDELRENLSLIDEASLFLLPLESGKAPTSLLRRLLSRVVP